MKPLILFFVLGLGRHQILPPPPPPSWYQQVEEEAGDYAVLFVYRPSRLSDVFTIPYQISINGNKFADLKPNSFTYLFLSEGDYYLDSDVPTDEYWIKAEPKGRYCVKFEPDWLEGRFVKIGIIPGFAPEFATADRIDPDLADSNYGDVLDDVSASEDSLLDEPDEGINSVFEQTRELRELTWREEIKKFMFKTSKSIGQFLIRLIVRGIWFVLHFVTYLLAAIHAFATFPSDGNLFSEQFFVHLSNSKEEVMGFQPFVLISLIIAVITWMRHKPSVQVDTDPVKSAVDDLDTSIFYLSQEMNGNLKEISSLLKSISAQQPIPQTAMETMVSQNERVAETLATLYSEISKLALLAPFTEGVRAMKAMVAQNEQISKSLGQVETGITKMASAVTRTEDADSQEVKKNRAKRPRSKPKKTPS